MKKLLLISAILALGLNLSAAEADSTGTAMTMQLAGQLVPRPALEPVKSLIPKDKSEAVDTIDTSDPRVKLLLRADHTWEYVRDFSVAVSDTLFTECWSETTVNPFKVSYSDLPFRTTLWLVDSLSHFYCPYQAPVFSKFGWRRGRQHSGVDIPYAKGTPVGAAFDGKVRFASRCGGYGNLVVVRHFNGLETFYGHLSRIDVKVGDMVAAGDILGLGGSTGRSSGPHLHFETRFRGFAFDPQWIIDFEKGMLKSQVYVLRRKLMSPGASYVPESEDEQDAIYLTEEQERAEEERIARELAAAKYHKIRSGDTLGALAVKYHTSVSAICKLNGISSKTTLKVGKTLRVK